MTTTIQKWGNSQGIRIPKYLLEALKWQDNEEITINVNEDKLVIEKADSKKKKTIAELFADYDGEYTPEEFNWGEPMGREVW